MDEYLKMLIEVVLFIIASYVIFYKSWLKALGNEVAKLVTVKQLTEITEDVKNSFNEKIELYKNKLNEELALKLEPIKSDLLKNNITYQIQYAYLHQERAKVILEIYRKLQELHSSMIEWTSFLLPIIEDAEAEKKARLNRVNTAINDFKNYYLANRLFFQKSFCDYIDYVFKEIWDKGWEFGYSQERIDSGQIAGEYFVHYSEKMTKISNEIREILPEKINEIEDKFRKILSVEDE